MNKFLDLDIFAVEVPSFTLEGRTQVRTATGAMCSILVFILTFAFALLKLEHMLIHKNPTIMTNEQQVESDEEYDLTSSDFMMAFALEDEKLRDPRYTRWGIRFWNQIES